MRHTFSVVSGRPPYRALMQQVGLPGIGILVDARINFARRDSGYGLVAGTALPATFVDVESEFSPCTSGAVNGASVLASSVLISTF